MPLEVLSSQHPTPAGPSWFPAHTSHRDGPHIVVGEVCRDSEGTDGSEGAGGRRWPGGSCGTLADLVAPFGLPEKEMVTDVTITAKGRGPQRERQGPPWPHLPGSCCTRQSEPPAVALRTVTKGLQVSKIRQSWAVVQVQRTVCTLLTALGLRPEVCHRRCTSWEQRGSCNIGAVAQHPTGRRGPWEVPWVASTPWAEWDKQDLYGMDRAGRDRIGSDEMGQRGTR